MIDLKDKTGVAQIRADVQHLCRTIGNRLAGWPGEEQAADWMVSRMEELGLENVAKLPYTCKRWRLDGGGIAVIDEREEEIACAPVTHAPSTSAQGVEGDLVIVEEGDYERALTRSDLDGKIALFHGSYGESAKTFTAMHDSALAALLFVDTRYQTPYPIATGMGEKLMALAKKPMAYVSFMGAWKLAKRGPCRVRLISRGTTEDARSWNVAGDLPAEDPSGSVIVVSGHLDSVAVGVGADDNASGIAAALECARRLKTLAGRRHTVRFIGFGAEEQLSVGSSRYVKEQAQDLDRIAFVLNFDTCAAWVGAGKALATGTPEMEAFLKGVIERKTAFGAVSSGVCPYQDAYPFALAGIPGVWLRRKTHPGGYWYHHSIHNNVANCSMERIAWAAQVACETLAELVTKDDWPFKRKIAHDLTREVDRLRSELFE